MNKYKLTHGTFALFIGTLFIFAFTLNGCAKLKANLVPSRTYIIVESSIVDTTKTDSIAEVTSTPRYSKMFSQIKSVALNAPSSCANQSTSTATGQAESRGSIVKTYCGVEMAEIEKALVRHGFTVYSWSMMNDALVDKKNNETAIEVARRLGAQVIFQVNSLERIKVNPGRDTRIERIFFTSNEREEKLNPLELEQRKIKDINEIIGDEEYKQLSSANKLGAMLDISAVDVETGQAIWFYQRYINEDVSRSVFANFFLKCWENSSCVNGREENQNNRQSAPLNKRNADIETLKYSARPASDEDAKYFHLLRNVIEDFENRFSSGK